MVIPRSGSRRRAPRSPCSGAWESILAFVLCAGSSFAQLPCDPLPPPAGPIVEVTPADVDDLPSWVYSAAPGTTFRLADGLYPLRNTIQIVTDGITIRSASGDRDAVVVDGGYDAVAGYLTPELIAISASDATISGLTLRYAYDHPIHISGPNTIITGVRLHDLRIVDPGQQAIKVNPVGEGWVDDGVVECSRIELTDFGRTQIRDDCYTGGIDVHGGWGWHVRRNVISGFFCDTGLSEHGIHFWKTSRDTLVEENVILDCARGIGFGLGETGDGRVYDPDPYPGVGYLGHIDGLVRNNFVAAGRGDLFSSEYGFDSGIGLEQARGTELFHNSVASTTSPRSSSVEWRFTNTLITLANHLVTGSLLPRNGAVATMEGNLESVDLGYFVDVAGGDLHLTAAAVDALDGGALLPPGSCDQDLDGEYRDAPPDVGADEAAGAIFADGFESGDLGAWTAHVPRGAVS